MGTLFGMIRSAVAEERYLVGLHAFDQMIERRILEWQVIAGVEDGKLLVERPKDRPNPVVEVRQSLPDGTDVKAVWALLSDGRAKLVTVHFFD